MPTVVDFNHKTQQSESRKESTSLYPVSRMGLFTSFATCPQGVHFETQEDTEHVVLFLRQHPIVLFPQIMVGIIMLIAPTILFPLAVSFIGSLPVSLPAGYPIIGTIFWYVATVGFFLATFIHWFFNIYIVTNQRIVDIDFINLLYKEFSEAELDKIQDLTFVSQGIFATIFNYGSVLVQTAGEMPNIEFFAVPQPDRVVKTIGELTKQIGKS